MVRHAHCRWVRFATGKSAEASYSDRSRVRIECCHDLTAVGRLPASKSASTCLKTRHHPFVGQACAVTASWPGARQHDRPATAGIGVPRPFDSLTAERGIPSLKRHRETHQAPTALVAGKVESHRADQPRHSWKEDEFPDEIGWAQRHFGLDASAEWFAVDDGLQRHSSHGDTQPASLHAPEGTGARPTDRGGATTSARWRSPPATALRVRGATGALST